MPGETPAPGEVPVRAASTLMWVRAASDGAPEVLLMKRHARSRFMPGAYVFAGGGVEPQDVAADAYGLSFGIDDVHASRLLDVARDGLSFYVAAARESFEECGLLLACESTGMLVDLATPPDGQSLRSRNEVASGARQFASVCNDHHWLLALDRLHYFAHWVTPVGLPRRFDTRFFIALAPDAQTATLAGEEMSDLTWRRPVEALEDHARGRFLLMTATRTMLSDLSAFDDTDALFDFARRPRKIEVVRPVLKAD